MVFQNKKLTVLYGSHTGNCQDLAERIWRESKRFYFECAVCSMDDYNIVDLTSETCVIFVCSTTGQGEEPENMRIFWKFLLKKSLPSNSLVNVNFAVLGLGDSSYVKFNFVAKRLYKRLLQLGGRALIPIGLGDDQHELGYDAAADPWMDNLWMTLIKEYPLPAGLKPLVSNLIINPRWNVSTLLKPNHNVLAQRSIYYSTKTSDEFNAIVKENKKITKHGHFQDVRLIKFKTNGVVYNPGDVVVLRPKNLKSQIEEFQKVLKENNVNIDPDELFEISETMKDMPVPRPLQYAVTFQQLCEEYFDLTSIPRRHTFNILAQLTDSDIEKEKCLEYTTAEGQTDLYNYCNRPRRNITEVLEDFRHATKNVTRDILFELLPPIKPRDFSIASSCKYHENEIHVLVAVVKYKTKLVKERLGLCSNYLADLSQNDTISAWIKRGSFKFPRENVPVIMVGPGTGVAPFKNYIYERVAENEASKDNLIMFFGCRNRENDFICQEEEELHQIGKITLINAFSRDQEYKVYVQHKIVHNSDFLWSKLATNKAFILVAGNSKNMPREVREAFVKVCQIGGGLDEQQAKQFIANMEKSNHYQTETWS